MGGGIVSALSPLKELGVQVMLAPGGKLKLRGSGSDEAKSAAMEYVRTHRDEILAALAQTGGPGECESCPAGGHWDYSNYAGQGLLCFHFAYYLGKPGKPKRCAQVRALCPRNDLPTAGRPRREAIAPGQRPAGWGQPSTKPTKPSKKEN